MKKEELNKIKTLLTKYELGQTSLAEENVLITYFQSKEVPQEWANYQAEFNYYATFRSLQFTESINTNELSTIEKVGQFLSKWYVISTLVLIPVVLSIFFLPHRPRTEQVNAIYDQADKNTTAAPINTDSTMEVTTDAQLGDIMVDERSTSPVKPVTPTLPKKDSIKVVAQRIDTIPSLDTTPISIEPTTISDFPPEPLPQTSKQDSLYTPNSVRKEVTFPLTENSTSGELARIARLANKADIEYTYVVDMHKKKIHELNIVMIIRSTGERSQLWISVPKKNSFSEVLSWTVDENGRAVSLCTSKIEHKARAKHPIE